MKALLSLCYGCFFLDDYDGFCRNDFDTLGQAREVESIGERLMKPLALGEVFAGRGGACKNATNEDFLNLGGSHLIYSPLVRNSILPCNLHGEMQ